MKIEVGYWETRDGRKARVLCTDAPGAYPIVGYMIEGGEASPRLWFADGSGVACGGKLDLERPWIDRPVVDWSKERDWVKAVAMDANGEWYRYEKEPVLRMDSGSWVGGGEDPQPMHPSEHPQFNGNSKDSLCVRPEVKA